MILPSIAGLAGIAGPVLQSSSDDDPFLFFLFLFGGGLFLVYWGWRRYRRYTLIRDTPTAKVRSMPVGRVELEGTARVAESALDAPFTDDSCLYADWHIEEYRYDSDDNDYDWETIASGTLATPFFLEDDTGRVLIDAGEDADFDLSDDHHRSIEVSGAGTVPPAVDSFIRTPRDDTDLTSVLGDSVGSVAEVFTDDGRIGNSSNRHRYVQNVLPVDSNVYVLGSARPVDVSDVPDREAGANEDLLAVRRDDETDLFLISDQREDSLVERYKKRAPVAVVGGLAASAVGLYFILSWYVFA